ncbi:MAG: tetrahydrofolate dehydrogenase/cyclohydrolase catalytic domain-containing protein, partial [Pseudomonadota bacterium]
MTRATLIDGKAFSDRIQARVTDHVARLREGGVAPGLAVVLVGEDPASEVYVRTKGRRTLEAGM